MPIPIACPHCYHICQAVDELEGHSTACPRCRQRFTAQRLKADLEPRTPGRAAPGRRALLAWLWSVGIPAGILVACLTVVLVNAFSRPSPPSPPSGSGERVSPQPRDKAKEASKAVEAGPDPAAHR